MKIQARYFTLLTLAAGLSVAAAGDLSGTIKLTGTPAPEKPLPLDPNCGKLHTGPVNTRFYVTGADKGLADVTVYLKGVAGKSAGPSAPTHVIDQKGCEYTPYISGVQTGQKIAVKNSDPMMHNVHPTPTVTPNKEENKAQMPGGADLNFTYTAAEMLLRFKCDVHPWMFSYVSVFDHPFFAVTGTDGSFKIGNIPDGKYTVVAQHRKGGTVEKEIEIKAGSKLDLTIEAK